MFTDTSATPTRVELLIDVVRAMAGRKLTQQTVRELLQPPGLPALTEQSKQAQEVLSAARLLGLISDEADGQIKLVQARDARPAAEILRETLDDKVLSSEAVEPWFALFYAYLLGRNLPACPNDGSAFEIAFNKDLFGDEKMPDRFNKTKYAGFRRWMRYAGLGWHDSADAFIANPYDRVRRALAQIFGKKRSMTSVEFMQNLAAVCPELDGGAIFLKANADYDASIRKCTTGLSHALIDLHLAGVIELNCPLDSDGWSIAAAAPPNDGKQLKSDKISTVSLPKALGSRQNG
ncbi:MAG TPA: hypothetical protein VFE34_19870 [Dongiaceae bacterium]|nr:hypothetical protein [Dongiaceae bacterium]